MIDGYLALAAVLRLWRSPRFSISWSTRRKSLPRKRGFSTGALKKKSKKATERSANAKSAAEAQWAKKGNENNGTNDADALQSHMRPQCQPDPDIGGGGAREASKEPFFEDLMDAIGIDLKAGAMAGKPITSETDFARFRKQMNELHLTETEAQKVVRDVMAAKSGAPLSSLNYFFDPLRRYAGERNAAPAQPIHPYVQKGGFDESPGPNFEDPYDAAAHDID